MSSPERPTLGLETIAISRRAGHVDVAEPRPKTESEIRRERIRSNLAVLYDTKTSAEIAEFQARINELIDRRRKEYLAAGFPELQRGYSHRDAFVIMYPDQVHIQGDESEGDAEPTMDTGEKFFLEKLSHVFNGKHDLPEYEQSKLDRGFSVKNHKKIKSSFGSWENTKRLAQKGFRTIKDFLVNHASMEGDEFVEGEINRNGPSKGFFESYPEDDPPHEKSKSNFTPRTTSNWTKVLTVEGWRYYRTTFGDGDTTDQADFDYHNWEVLFARLDDITYIQTKGGVDFRIDSLPFAWKELDGPGIHEPKVRNLLQIFTDVLHEVNPATRILAENNVKQEQNLSYLTPEEDPLADEAYNFILTPFLYHALYTEQVDDLIKLLRLQPELPEGKVQVNHVACHDGTFLEAAKAVAEEWDRGKPEAERGTFLKTIFDNIEARGGVLAKRRTPTGEEHVYELDSTTMSAVSYEDEDPQQASDKVVNIYFLASQFGMPAVYLPTLLGARNDHEAYERSGKKKPRELIRMNFNYHQLMDVLADENSEVSRHFNAMMNMLAFRTTHPAFDPTKIPAIVDHTESVYGLEDSSKTRVIVVRNQSEQEDVLALHNFSSDRVEVGYEGVTYSLNPFQASAVILPHESQHGDAKEYKLFQTAA